MAGNAAAPAGPRRTRNNPSPGGLRSPLPPVTRPRKKPSRTEDATLASQVASQSDSESADNQGPQANSQVEDSEDQQTQQPQSSSSRSARAFARTTRSASRSVSPSHITAPKGKAKKPLPLPTTFESPTATPGPSTHQGVGSIDTSSRKGKEKRARTVDSDNSDADDEAAGEQRPVKRPRGEVRAADADADAPWEYFDRSNVTPKGPGRSFLQTSQNNLPQEPVVEHTKTTPQDTSRLSEKVVHEEQQLSPHSVRRLINQQIASSERAALSAKKPEIAEQQPHASIGVESSSLVASPAATSDQKALDEPVSSDPVQREIDIKQRFGSIRKPRFPPNHNRNRNVRESINLSDDEEDYDLPPPRRATAEDVIRHRNIRMAKKHLDALLDNKQPILMSVEEAKQHEPRIYRKQSSKLSASRNSMAPSSSKLKSSPSALNSSPSSMESFFAAMRPSPSALLAVVRYLKDTGTPFVLDTPPAAEAPLLTAHDWFAVNQDFIPSSEEQYAMLQNYKKSRIQASASPRNTPNGYNSEDPDGGPPRKDRKSVADHSTPSAQALTDAPATPPPQIPGGFASPVQQREPVTPVHHLQDSEGDDDSMSDTSDREVSQTTTTPHILTPELQAPAQQSDHPNGWVSTVKNIMTSPFKFWAGRSQPAAVSTTDLSRPAFTFDHPSKVPKLPTTPLRQSDRALKSKSERRGPRANRPSPTKSQPQTEQRRPLPETHLPIEQRGRPNFDAIRRQDEFETQAALKREKQRMAEAIKADTDASARELPHKSPGTFQVPSCSSSESSDDDRMDVEDDISGTTSKTPSFHQSTSVPTFPTTVDEGPFMDRDGNMHDFPLVPRTPKPILKVNLNINFQKISMKSPNFYIPNIERLGHLKGVPVSLRSPELRLDKIADPERVRQQWSHIEWNERQAAELFREMYRRAFMNVPQNSKKLNGQLLKGQPWFVKLLGRYDALKDGVPQLFYPISYTEESLLMRKYALMRLRAIVELDQLDMIAAKEAGIDVIKAYAQDPFSDYSYRLDPIGSTPTVDGGCPEIDTIEPMRKGFYEVIPKELKHLEETLAPPKKITGPMRNGRAILPGSVILARAQAIVDEMKRTKALIKSSVCEHCDDQDALFDVGPISAPDTPARKEYLKSLPGFKDPSFYGDGNDSDGDGAGDFNDVEGGGEDEVDKVPSVVEKSSVESSSRVPQPSVESSSRVPQPSVESSTPVPPPSVEPSTPVPPPKAIPTDWNKYHPRKPSQLREVVQMSPLQEVTSNVPRFKAVADVFKDLLVDDFVPMEEAEAMDDGRMSRIMVQEIKQDQKEFRVYGGIEVVM